MGESLESFTEKRRRLLSQYPDYCTLADVARELKLTRAAVVKTHAPNIKHITVEGWTLYNRQAVSLYSGTIIKDNGRYTSRIVLTGRDVERIKRIAAVYYRSQLDREPEEFLRLAKRVGGI